MKPIYIFRHIECEGPGYLGSVLTQKNIPYTLYAIDRNDHLPHSVSECSGLVFMGGPMSVNDNLEWIEQELSLIQQAHQFNLPVLGHCLGGQLISKALGGTVRKNKVKEIGWHSVNVANNPIAQHWLNDLSNPFQAFHWHGETFSLPQGATLLLENGNCDHQAFALGNILAFQCHIEMTETLVQIWAQEYRQEIANPNASIQSYDQILENLATRVHDLQQVADAIYTKWIALLKN